MAPHWRLVRPTWQSRGTLRLSAVRPSLPRWASKECRSVLEYGQFRELALNRLGYLLFRIRMRNVSRPQIS